MDCLFYTCKNKAMDCDVYCAEHRAIYGLYMPMTYVQAYNKAKEAHERTGDKYFVYRHNRVNHLHKGYGTSKVTRRNWVNAIFSEICFPNDGLVSTETAQKTMFAILHGGESDGQRRLQRQTHRRRRRRDRRGNAQEPQA